MNKQTRREVIATLLKAGRRDLARQFVGAAAQPPTTEKLGWPDHARPTRDGDAATIVRYVRSKDGSVIDHMEKYQGGSGNMVNFLRAWQPGARGWSYSNMLLNLREVDKWLKSIGKDWSYYGKAWKKTNTVEW